MSNRSLFYCIKSCVLLSKVYKFRRHGRYGKFVVLQHPHNGLGTGQSTGVNFQQHKGGVLPDTAHLPVKIAAVCDVVRVVGDIYIAASVGRAQPWARISAILSSIAQWYSRSPGAGQ